MSKVKKTLCILLAIMILAFSVILFASADATNHIGDIDNDGKISAADARLALRASVGLEKLTDTQSKSADVNNDGKVTAADARTILRVSVGLEKFDIDSENMISVDEIEKMEIVSNTISNHMKSDEYINLDSNEEKVEYITNLLIDLSNQGLITKNSIQYSESDNSFIYEHINGVRSFIWLNTFSNLEVGFDNYSLAAEYKTMDINNELESYSSIREITNVADTVFMYGLFKQNEEQSYFEKYDSLMREYSKQGLVTTIYNNPTVNDYKTAFIDAKYISIIEHGGFNENLNISYFRVSGDKANKDTLLAYNTDIYFERIFTGTDGNGEETFIIAPKFFEFYYSNNKLDDAVVFLFCCQGFGANGNVNYEFAKAFEKCGVNTTIGFHNTVFEDYAFSIYNKFTDSMLYGYTADKALKNATDYYCEDDIKYMYMHRANSNWWVTPDEKHNGKTGKEIVDEKFINDSAAYPIIYGEKNKKFDIILSSINGTVTDSETGNPISNVTVEVIDNESGSLEPVKTAITDTNGKYSLELPYGSYSLSFNHENYEYYGTSLSVNYEAYEENATLSPKGDSGDTEERTVIDSGDCGADGDNVTWTLYEDGELVISGNGKMKNYSFYFYSEDESLSPQYWKYVSIINKLTINYGVIYIGTYSFVSLKVNSIELPNSINEIGNYAFYNCSLLKEIKISNTCKVIGEGAFNCCRSLTEITLPHSVLAACGFWECNNLEKLKIINPKCEIDNAEFGLLDVKIIYGYKNSTAQKYAEEYCKTFVVLD